MNKKFTKLMAALALLTFLAPSMVGWGQTRTDEVYKTLTFTKSTSTQNQVYTGSWTETVGTNSWTIACFNNNNWGWKDGDLYVIKCGRKKSGSNNTPSVATITTNAAIDEAITKVVVKLTAINSDDYNSIRLYVASDDEFSQNLTTITVSPIPTSPGDMTITVPEASRAANRYYKLEFDTKGTLSSNGHTGVSKVEYYHNAAPADPSITISEEDLQLPYTENENGNFTVNYSNFEPAAATAVLYSDQACTQAFPTTGDDAWIWLYDDDLEEPYSIPYMVTTNGSITDRTVYLKVEAMDGDLNMIDEVFTITQAAMPTYTVTYNANGATGNAPSDAMQYTPLSNTVTVLGNDGSPALAKTGYTWSGWCLDAGCTGMVYGPRDNQTHTYTISENTTFYAKWTINSYNVTLPAEDEYGTYTMNKENPVAYGTEVTLTFTPKTGYENYVATWRVNGTALVGNKFTMPDEAVTVTIELVENPFVTTSLTSDDMKNMKDSDGNAIINSGGTNTSGYGILKFKTTSHGFTWITNGWQATSGGSVSLGMIQIRDRENNDGVSYVQLPEFNGKIETISMTVTSGGGNTSSGSVCKALLHFQVGNTKDETPIVSDGDKTNGTNSITLDLSNGFYSTGFITATDAAARIWDITVTYRPYKNLTGTTITTIDADRAIAITANAPVTVAEGLTIPASSGILIKSGASLSVTGTLTNSGTAANLVIEDGGQLITSNAVNATVQKNITGYGNDNNVKTGWNFIASPLTSAFAPDATMTSNTYDLYRLNPSNSKWENYKAMTEGNNPQPVHADFTGLVNGRGYLYANSNDVTLSFAGTIKPFTTASNGNQVELAPGWNLVGNPYTFNVYSSKSYYTITTVNNENVVTAVESAASVITPCTGIVVKNTGTETDHVAFLESAAEWASGNQGNIQMVLAQQATNRGNSSTLDNAIVSFNEGNELPKFYFGEQNANLYIPQGTEEYAIAYSNGQGEMPVNFRANEDGQYTLTVNPENVEMNYLHLIDNMTGADIDLLAEPSYTFTAKTTDYESRFKLVFAANTAIEDNTNETFAFFSDGQLIVNGEGTLQIFDALGRQLMCKQLSTLNCQLSTVNYSPGVYMLRLVNGDNVKVQKVVVR